MSMSQINDIRMVNLFTGAGGLTLGFILAQHPSVRYRPIFAFDNDKKCLDSFSSSMNWLVEHAPAILPTVPAVFKRDLARLNTQAVSETVRSVLQKTR